MQRKSRFKTITAVQAGALALMAIFGAFTAQSSQAKACKTDLSAPAAASCQMTTPESR